MNYVLKQILLNFPVLSYVFSTRMSVSADYISIIHGHILVCVSRTYMPKCVVHI